MNIDKAKYNINAHFVKLSLYTMEKMRFRLVVNRDLYIQSILK